MKNFITKAGLVLLFVCLIDITAGFVGNYVIMHMPESNAFVSHTTFSVLRKTTDILIVGASKAKHGIDPFLLRDSLGMESYNAGEDGCDMMYYDMVLQGVVSRRKPKIVILDLAPLSLHNTPGLSKFLYGMSPIVDRFAKNVFPWSERLKLKSNLYRLNGFFPQLSSLLLDRNLPHDGFTPLEGVYTKAENLSYSKLIIDDYELPFLKDFINTCKKRNIRLFVYISPTYYHNNLAFNRFLKDYCRRYNVFFRDDSAPQGFQSPSYYNDRDHVNEKGAEIFTRMIIRDIKSSQN